MLIENGANANGQDTPLDIAIRVGNTEIAQALIAAGVRSIENNIIDPINRNRGSIEPRNNTNNQDERRNSPRSRRI